MKERILEENKDDAIKNRAYYYLAKISYQRGYLNTASDYINNVKGNLDILYMEVNFSLKLTLLF